MDTIDTPMIAQARGDDFGPQRDMDESDFEAMRVAIRNQALLSIDALGAVAPALFLPTVDPQGAVVRMSLVPVDDMLAHAMGPQVIEAVTAQLLADPNHDFAILLHEAWTIHASGDSSEALDIANGLAASGASLGSHPGAVEAVVMRMRSKTREAFCFLPISRDEHGKIQSIADEPLMFTDAPGVRVGSPSVAFPDGPPLDESRPRGATLH